MASRRTQVRASILVSKKVMFLGRWHTNEVTEDIMQHLRRNLPLVPSQKAKLKLSELGIFFGKRVVIGRTQDEFIPMDKIVQVVPDAVHTTVLLCLIKTGTKSIFDILVFRCGSEKDARESAEVFRRLRALYQNSRGEMPNANNNNITLTSTENTGFYTTNRNSSAHNRNLNQQMVVIAAPSPQPSPGAEEQEEAILVVTPEPAISPGNEEAIIAANIRSEQLYRSSQANYQNHPFRRVDESDAAFKRRMRQQVKEALKRNRNRSDAETAMLCAVVPDESDNAEYLADSEFDQISLSDSITAQQKALNDKVLTIAEEVNRLRSVFETTLRHGASTNVIGDSSTYNRRYHHGRSTSSESGHRSRSPPVISYSNNNLNRSESPYTRDVHSPPLAPGEMYRRRHIISETTQMASPAPSLTGRSRRQQFRGQQTIEPDVPYLHKSNRNGGSMNDLLITAGTVNNRRSSGNTTTNGIPVAPLVRANVAQGNYASRSNLQMTTGGGGYGIGTTSSKIISRQHRQMKQGASIQRSRSTQWLGSSHQMVSTQDLAAAAHFSTPDDDEQIRRQRELAERIRQEHHNQPDRQVVRAQMGVVEHEKWALGPEPVYLIRSDNKVHADRAGGVKLYKARSVPNFLVANGQTTSTSTRPPPQQQITTARIVQQQQKQQHNTNNISTSNLVRVSAPTIKTTANSTMNNNGQPTTYYVAVPPNVKTVGSRQQINTATVL